MRKGGAQNRRVPFFVGANTLLECKSLTGAKEQPHEASKKAEKEKP